MKKKNKRNTNILEQEISLLGGSKIKVWYALFVFVLGIATVSLLSQEVGDFPGKFYGTTNNFAKTSIADLSESTCLVTKKSEASLGDFVDITISCNEDVDKAYYFWEEEDGYGKLREISKQYGGYKAEISYWPEAGNNRFLYIFGRKGNKFFTGNYKYAVADDGSISESGEFGDGPAIDPNNDDDNNNGGGSGSGGSSGGENGGSDSGGSSGGEDDNGSEGSGDDGESGGSGGSGDIRGGSSENEPISFRISSVRQVDAGGTPEGRYYHGAGNQVRFYIIGRGNIPDGAKVYWCGNELSAPYQTFTRSISVNSGPEKMACRFRVVDANGKEIYKSGQTCISCDCDPVTGSLLCSHDSYGHCGISCEGDYCASSTIRNCGSLETRWESAIAADPDFRKSIYRDSNNYFNSIEAISLNCGAFSPSGCRAKNYPERYHVADCTLKLNSSSGKFNGESYENKCLEIKFNGGPKNNSTSGAIIQYKSIKECQ